MLSSLETFVTLYETRSFTKTAECLYVTQPTVTTRIKKLEDSLSIKLFIRTDLRTTIPTHEADELYPKAKTMITFWGEAQERIKLKKKEKIAFTLAFSPNASSLFFEQIFKVIQEYIDTLEVSFYVYDSQKIIEQVESQKIDFAIIERPLTSIHVEKFIFAEDDLVWAGIDNSEIFITLETQKEPGAYIKKFLKENKKKFSHIVNTTESPLIIETINKGLGSTLTSSLLISKDLPYKKLGPDYHRYFLGVYSKYTRNPLILEIINDIKNISECSCSEPQNINL